MWGLLMVGLILVIEPALPWYHFSPFWFSLGVASVAVSRSMTCSSATDVRRKEGLLLRPLLLLLGAVATNFPYLTTVEGLKLAAQAFSKDVKMLSCCAGKRRKVAPV